MNLPSRLADLLAKNDELTGAVKLTLHDFLIWFADRNMVFFPEYTDHGPKHIEEVMTSAESIIEDESWRYLTPEDAATLVLSILLHDCAMHLSEEGFISLVNPADSRNILPGFNDRDWPELWAEFLSEASRFDARKLNALFGDTEPIHRPALDAREMTLRDRLLIGEFLRRHHPRLAHEIAMWGVPGPKKDKLELVRVPRGLADLAGLIARSHGLNLRDCVDVIARVNRREFHKVHVPFLMAIVRVADYIQIHSERAPKQVLKVRSLKSPISQGEWKAHEAIEDIHCTHDDPEALVVIAHPPDVKIYLKLQWLLTGLQKELDECWAVLGEVYGRVRGLQDLGLTIRRVRSNLDDKLQFAKSVSYYPEKITFQADPEILKLLVGPLYGNQPPIAIRELIQNAVDACNELRDYVKNVSNIKKTEMKLDPPPHVDVQLERTDDGGWLTVTDTGIGMTAEVVKDYFLRAGASFRRSDVWKMQHESEEGKSRVLRSGRFGIGILAAFLLGTRLEVTSRHISCAPEMAIKFSCSIDDNAIELERYSQENCGTTIRIKLTNQVIKELPDSSWDWYCLATPRVERTVRLIYNKVPEIRLLPQKHTLPSAHSSSLMEWHRIQHPDFEGLHWSYEFGNRSSKSLFCNGIKVTDWYDFRQSLKWPLNLRIPSLSVFDPDGKLPLNLARSTLVGELPFEPELLEAILKDLFSQLLVNTPEDAMRPFSNSDVTKLNYEGIHRQWGWYQLKYDWFWMTPGGVALASPWFLKRVAPSRLFLVPDLYNLPFAVPRESAHIINGDLTASTLGEFDPWVRLVLTGIGNDDRNEWLQELNPLGARILLAKHYWRRIERLRAFPKSVVKSVVEEWSDGSWIILRTGECQPNPEFRKFTTQALPATFTAIGEWYLKPFSDDCDETDSTDGDKTESVLVPLWKQIMGEPVVPFDMKLRRKRFAKAFELLRPYIELRQGRKNST